MKRASRTQAVGTLPHLSVSLSGEANFFTGLAAEGPLGLFVPTYRHIPVGATVALAIDGVGSEQPILAQGVVRWHRDGGEEASPGLGLELRVLSRDDRAWIDAYGRQRPPLYYEVA